MPQTDSQWLIKGGVVVDGTGSDAFPADVRVRDGFIVEVAPDLSAEPSEQVHDAGGCYVSPGFIESHTHFDGTMWWQPDLDPLPGHGVTTIVMGNCGFALAPLPKDEAARAEVVKIFSFFEDIPEQPFFDNLPWDWQNWPEYKESVRRGVKVPTHYAAFVGHIAIRLAAMGMEAWSRAATPSEVEQMCVDLDQALSAGALGMSTNLMDHDGTDRPVPSLHADDAEITALLEVLARHRGATLQIVIDTVMRMTAVEALERVERLIGNLPIRLQWAGLPTLQWQKDHGIQKPLLKMHERYAREEREFYTGYAHVPITTVVSFDQSLLFAQSNDYVWHEVVTAEGTEAKFELLRDPEWRARARHSWDELALPTSPFRNARLLLLDQSQNGTGPIDLTLGDYADSLSLHPSDAFAEWLLANGMDSTATAPDWDRDLEMINRLLTDPYTVGNISDAGAHGQMFCGAGDNIMLFTEFVRDNGVISIEEAVHIQTAKLAEFFGFADRGRIAAGMRADLTVFALDEIERRPKRKVYDVPDGKGGATWRWTRDAAPMRLTLVDGVATFEDGKATGARPGTPISPAIASS